MLKPAAEYMEGNTIDCHISLVQKLSSVRKMWQAILCIVWRSVTYCKIRLKWPVIKGQLQKSTENVTEDVAIIDISPDSRIQRQIVLSGVIRAGYRDK